ncbi:MAG: hypothetical protein QM233_02925, partial [Candidatus Cloacimonadota bacterium]|nr:hypothetical protein [Candidatus Cloacimonadota bacterium]
LSCISSFRSQSDLFCHSISLPASVKLFSAFSFVVISRLPFYPVKWRHFSTFPLFVAPIYYRGMGLICITLSGFGFPGVILNLVRDDLRMMAPNTVTAREGGMKDIAECLGIIMRLSRK